MKRRIVAAGLAAATALSLSVAPAQAASKLELTSSYESSSKMYEKRRDDAGRDPKKLERVYRVNEALYKFTLPSSENDWKNDYTMGTTFDILLGTGIAVAVLALLGGAAQSGQLPLPKLPF
ncbi:hypothetical protein [Corynebacterium sp. 20_84]